MDEPTDRVADLRARCEAAERRAEQLERLAAEARNEAQREVDAALTDLRMAQRIARIGNWSFDPAVGVPVWSDEVYAIYERDPALGPIPLGDYPKVYSGRDWERFHSAITRAIEDGTPYEIELRVELSSGRCKWIHAICEPEAEAGPAGHFLRGTIQDITERREFENRLRAQRQMLADAERLAGVGGWVWHVPEDAWEFSESWLAIHGCDGPPAGLDEIRTLAHPDDLVAIQEAMEKATSGHGPYDIEHRIVRRDTGEVRVVRAYGEATRVADGQVLTLSGAALDVTDQRRVETELRDRQLEVEQILQALPDALVYADPDRRIARVNRNFETQFGYSSAEALGHETKLIYADAEDYAEQGRLRYNREARETHEPYVVSYRRKDGSVFPGETVGTPVRDGKNQVVGLLGMIRDVTEKQKAEAALRESEERFRALLDNVAKVSVQGYAPDGTTIFWNEGSRQLYGYTAEEALGQNLLELIIPPELRADVAREMDAMARAGVPVPSSELELMRKDGSRVTVYSSHCMVTPRDRPQELFCIDVDLSDVRQAEAERERLREQLAQAQRMESVGRLAGGVAHDFNNMLSVILGHAEIASLTAAPHTSERAHLDEIVKAAERSATLVRQLLTFARRQTVAPKQLDLNQTIGDMLSMLRRLIGESIELVWSPGEDVEPVRMDPAQIDQMLANLVVNAKDAIGGAGRIEISTWPVRADECPGETSWSRGVRISIRDDGHGMDETTREQIFEPFFTTKGVGEGTGLGLATVYGIVKQNRGAIEVRSAPGEGAEFTIYLPVAYGELNGAADTEVEPEDVPGGTETVLLAEDESAIVSMAKDMLAGVGYRVLTSSNPAEALRSARQHRTELKLLVTDVVMPQMNGQDLARIVSEEVPGLAVLFMSGYSADVISDKGVLADGVHFLAKPFTVRQMATAVRRAIDGNVREPLGR